MTCRLLCMVAIGMLGTGLATGQDGVADKERCFRNVLAAEHVFDFLGAETSAVASAGIVIPERRVKWLVTNGFDNTERRSDILLKLKRLEASAANGNRGSFGTYLGEIGTSLVELARDHGVSLWPLLLEEIERVEYSLVRIMEKGDVRMTAEDVRKALPDEIFAKRNRRRPLDKVQMLYEFRVLIIAGLALEEHRKSHGALPDELNAIRIVARKEDLRSGVRIRYKKIGKSRWLLMCAGDKVPIESVMQHKDVFPTSDLRRPGLDGIVALYAGCSEDRRAAFLEERHGGFKE